MKGYFPKDSLQKVLAHSIRSMETEDSPGAAWRAGLLLAPAEPPTLQPPKAWEKHKTWHGSPDKNLSAPVLHQLTNCKIKQDAKS